MTQRLQSKAQPMDAALARTLAAGSGRRQHIVAQYCVLLAVLATACPRNSRPRDDGGVSRTPGSGAGAYDAAQEPAADGGSDAGRATDSGGADARVETPADAGDDAAAPPADAGDDAAAQADAATPADDAGAEEDVFEVRATAPDREIVDLAAPLRVSLTAAVDASSLTATTFVVKRAGKLVPGDRVADGDAIVFQPRPAWALAARYSVELTAGLRDVEGRALVPQTIELQAKEGTWKVEQRSPARQQPRSDLVVAANGDAAVSWVHEGIQLSRYSPKTGWTPAERISDEVDAVLYPSLAINERGQLIATWNYIVNPVGRVYLPEQGWQPHFYFRGVPGGGQEVKRALWSLSDAGDAVGVFAVSRLPPVENGTVDAIGFNVGSEMREVHSVSPTGPGYDLDPHVARVGGEPVFTWVEDIRSNPEQPRPEVWLRRGFASEPMRVSADQRVARAPAIASAVDGSFAWLVWEEVQEGKAALWATKLPAAGARTAPERISEPFDASDLEANPVVAIDAAGVVHVVWEQPPSAAIWATRLDPASGWQPGAQLTAAGAVATQPVLAVEPGGNAFVAWAAAQRGKGMDLDSAPVITARYLVGSGWTPPAELASGDRGASMVSDRTGLTLAVDHGGRAFCTWTGNNHFQVARFE